MSTVILTTTYVQNVFNFFSSLLLGIPTIQTHPTENDSVNWSNDAGMHNIDALSGNSWPQFYVARRVHLVLSLSVKRGLCQDSSGR